MTIHSHQLLGLIRIFGRDQIKFEGRGFPITDRPVMLVKVDGHRFVFDTDDRLRYEMAALEWCDIYAKVNIDNTISAAPHENKIVPIGAHFPVRIMGFFPSIMHSLMNYLRFPYPDFREHLANYYRQWRYHHAETDLIPTSADDQYIFTSSSIWRNDNLANDTRAYFCRAAKSIPDLTFEGGLIPRYDHVNIGYEDVLSSGRYDISTYLEKTRRSTIVFNTPAVKQTHSWKLGEYLALGKTILSVPIVRPLPEPLIHGTHLHVVEPTAAAIREGVEYLLRNKDYRQHLAANARNYYDTVAKPEIAVKRILDAAQDWSTPSLVQ